MSEWRTIEYLKDQYGWYLAFEIEPDQEVGCVICREFGDNSSYGRGEAFLVDAGHAPCNGDVNYVCAAHLSDRWERFDPHNPPATD